MKIEIEMIPMIEARDMPEDILDFCIEKEYSTHYQNEVVCTSDKENLLIKYLEQNGHIFTGKYMYVAIIAT